MPSIPSSVIADQYAFKPSGSTDAALISMMHTITYLLETNNYVRCLMVDFSKAFDTVNHIVLIRKLCSLGLPANIFNWVIFSQGELSTARSVSYTHLTLPTKRIV